MQAVDAAIVKTFWNSFRRMGSVVVAGLLGNEGLLQSILALLTLL